MKISFRGLLQVVPEILNIEKNIVKFKNGTEKNFDAIVLATGYKSAANKWLKVFYYYSMFPVSYCSILLSYVYSSLGSPKMKIFEKLINKVHNIPLTLFKKITFFLH